MADRLRQLLLRRQHWSKALIFFIALALYLISRFHVVLIIWSFIGGIAICCSFINSETLLPNFMRWHMRKKKRSPKQEAKTPQQDDELSLLKKVCPVCGKDNCSRHRPELNIVALQPWTNLKIPEKVDEALDEFFSLVLKEFIFTWYRDLSQDEAFLDELKTSLRFIVSVLLRRIKKVDLPQFILDSVLKIAIRHLHFYVQVKNRAKPDTDLPAALIDYYGAHLHCAARNRQAELSYLRSTSERVFPYILPLHALKCRGLCVLLREILGGAILLPAMDKIADPDIINNLLLVFLDISQTPPRPPSPRQVPILADFAKPLADNQSCLHVELTEILSNPKALFPFMQFMKTEASVNVLQFYLSAEEFNTKILTPELTHDELVKLHVELKDLFRMYCAHNAADRIQFDDDIVSQLQDICDGSPEDVIKLQRTTPLFRAYEHAYTLLEGTFLPLFHQSDDYYSMLCGQRLPTKLTRSLSRANKRVGDALSFSKLGNKIKGVFKSNTVVKLETDNEPHPDVRLAWSSMDDSLSIVKGSSYLKPNFLVSNSANSEQTNPTVIVEGDRLLDDVDCCVEEALPIMRTDPISDLFPDTLTFTDDGPLHDLSAWRVTIIDVALRPEPENPKKTFYTFVVEVRRVDVLENDFEASNWTVERRYSEFYVLEQKLSEFHGEFDDAVLPPKKSFGTKNKEFLEARRPEFEQYLQKLLTKPKLRGSELLYKFLTPRSEFTTGFLTDINLGKFMKSGAMKLVKERGQHLETFLQSLQTSIETPKPKPSRFADVDADTISISSEQMANSLYENNADIDFDLSPATPVVLCPGFEYPVDGAYDTILYLIEYVYTAPKWLLTMLLSLRIIFRNSIDTFLDWYLGTRLDRALQEHRLIRVINLLRDALFFNTDPPRTDEQKEERRDRALRELKDYIPKLFVQVVGPNKHEESIELIFELLQYPTLNKQLSYMLFDKIVEELFPEVLNAMDDDPLKELLRAARGDD